MQKLLIIPLSDAVIYPHVIIPHFYGQNEFVSIINNSFEKKEELLFVPQENEAPSKNTQLHHIGTIGRVSQLYKLSDGTIKAMLEGAERVRIITSENNNGMLYGEYVILCENTNEITDETRSMGDHIIKKFSDYLRIKEQDLPDIIDTLKKQPNSGRVADIVVAHLEATLKERIHILDIVDINKRVEETLILLQRKIDELGIDKRIQKRVKEQMERNQREYYLNEKIKAIQKELGEMDDVFNDFDLIEKAIDDAQMPIEADKKARSELNKLRQMPSTSSEAIVVRNYLDWIVEFPWSKKKRASYNLVRAEKILNRDHYGLEDVKERILEYLAVQKRNKNGKGPIICLVGPPGVGKTSLGKSIAEATGRDFDRISLGGVRDEAEIRGHRRTYIGSLPGKIVQKLCKLGSNNPVILLDEIDKMGMDHRGDPASALLEVLDPAQNNSFNDHYLETDIDLSKVLFIATANTLNIPSPLLDRMEVIRLPGYTAREKYEIATRYILPRQRAEHALKKDEFIVQDDVINHIIEDYTREAGVRNLEREINKIARKSVRKLYEPDISHIEIRPDNLEDFLGVAHYKRSEDDLRNKIGCVTGLAWTSVGGETLQIETAVFQGKGKLNLTGQLGDVMKESVEAALSVVRQYLEQHNHTFQFNTHDIHMHLPEGATPKDGPSAGIGMATALLSALTQIPVRGDIAMTGEITLYGRVLAIGGLKEKLLAAVRSRITTVLIPEENRKDLREIPDEVKKALEIIPVNNINQVFNAALILEKDTLADKILALDFTPAKPCTNPEESSIRA